MKPVVSIITAVYNSEKFVEETIKSVLAQEYINWEMLIVDDCSNDSTPAIIQKYSLIDERIKVFKTNKPSGSPTLPRNLGISVARGRYIAFLDGDDLWFPDKLEQQVKLFEKDNVAIVFSDYEKISEDGARENRIIKAPAKVSYSCLLKGNVIGCSTVLYDTYKVGKCQFKKQGHEDYALWLSMLKKGYVAKNCQLVTTQYRIRKGSVSANKIKVIAWIWRIYRINERLSILNSFYYSIITLTKSLFKYLK